MDILLAEIDTQMAVVSIFGFFVMVILPLAFVASLSAAILAKSRKWSVITVVTGVLFLAATAVAIQFAIQEALVTNFSPFQEALMAMETPRG